MLIKFKAKDGVHKSRVEGEVGDSWPEQVELFHEFLSAQGFIVTYKSFLYTFGDIVKDRDDVYKED